MPPRRQIMLDLRLSNVTVQRALRELKEEGWLVSRSGSGVYVADARPARKKALKLWVEPMDADAIRPHRVRLLHEFAQRQPKVRVIEKAGARDLRDVDINFLPQQADSLEDITDLVTETLGHRECGSEMLAPFQCGGQVLLMPTELNVLIMACNLDVFERAGVPLPSPEWDWQEFLEAGEALKAKTKDVSGAEVNVNGETIFPVVWQAGGAVFSADGLRCLLDSDAAIRAGESLRSWQRDCALGAPMASAKRIDLFIQGRVGMMTAGVNKYRRFNEAGCRWAALPLPRDARSATLVMGQGYGLLRHSPSPEIAGEFLQALPSWELWPENRGRPSALPLHRSLERDGDIERTYREAFTFGRPLLADIEASRRRAIHVHTESIIRRYLWELLKGGEPVVRVLRRMTAEINYLISEAEEAPA